MKKELRPAAPGPRRRPESWVMVNGFGTGSTSLVFSEELLLCSEEDTCQKNYKNDRKIFTKIWQKVNVFNAEINKKNINSNRKMGKDRNRSSKKEKFNNQYVTRNFGFFESNTIEQF